MFPFVIGWAGGYFTWKVLAPTQCGGRGGKLYGIKKPKPKKGKR